jgi:ABC-2 type transport system permease protein
MTRALFKKQMLEVFSWLYRDSKFGKRRSTKGIVGYGLLYLLLFGFLSAIFAFVAKMFCAPMINAHMGWLYWCLMGLIAIFFGVFGSVFNTYGSLYQAKDNDLLLSMPIPISRILPIRLSGVYAMGLMYELIVMIPTIIVWFAAVPVSVVGTIHIFLITLVLSLLILVLSAVLGWVVALIAAKVKHKNIITVIVSLTFIAVYYYFYARAYSLFQELLLHLDAIGNTMKNIFYPLYHMGLAAEGRILSMLIFATIVLVVAAITYRVLSLSFLKLATANCGSDKTIYKDKTVKPVSVQSALLRKEFQRFTGSANYMLNCGLGIILTPVSAVALVWKADVIREFITIPEFADYIPLFAVAVICLLTTMNDMAAPSVSLEGKNLWIAQSLPVSGRKVLRAKLMLQLLLTWIPLIPLVIVLEWLIKPKLLCAVLLPVLALLFSLLMAEIGLSLNLKMPNFHWTSEIVPIKQSMPVAVTLFGGWLIIVVFAGVYVLLRNVIRADAFLAAICAVKFVAAGWLHHWLMTKGARIFEEL